MSREFSISGNKVFMNMSLQYFDSSDGILNSDSFKTFLEDFIRTNKEKSTRVYAYLERYFKSSDVENLSQELADVLRFLSIMNIDQVSSKINKYHDLNLQREELSVLIEDLYDYRRKLERYTIIDQRKDAQGIEVVNFLKANNSLKDRVLEIYRKLEVSITGFSPNVYRQVQAGANAGLVVRRYKLDLPEGYEFLEKIPFISNIMVETPYITYTKSNKRDGFFKEVEENPLVNAQVNPDHFFCYPAKVGDNLIYIYFHRDLMTHGIATSNLFELASEREIVTRKPDAIYVYGSKEEGPIKDVFYIDDKNDLLVGYINYNDQIDYFGYLKKMCLTLNNIINIRRGYLPIHGAGVNIVLKDGKSANVVILGDSGAGKSESIEAFRALAKDYIRDMTVIFDDMGSFRIKDGEIYAYGTEIGAFVRLDDLDAGYAFKQIDRSIFMNVDKVNARLIMPVSSYDEIMAGYKVDFFLYANNYEEVKKGDRAIKFFDNEKDAMKVFKKGERMAKGTTTEKGLVATYFANPFGPYQKQEECDKLLDLYFNKLYENKVKVGMLRTQLAIKNMEFEGPKNAAIDLFEEIKKL